MADSTTTTYGLTKPEVGASEDTWGNKLNTNFDTLDDLLDGTTAISPNLTVGSWEVGGTAITATAAELNLLDGVTATTAELNIMDGVTATTAEINKLDGLTATTTELNYVDGVTSNIQTQLNAKADDATTISAGGGLTGGGSLGANRTISHADTSSQASVNNSGNTFIQDITLDTYGHITGITSGTAVINDPTIYMVAGAGLTGGGDFTLNDSSADSISFTVKSDLRGVVEYVGMSTSDYYQSSLAYHDWYLDGTLDMRLDNTGTLFVDGDIIAYSTTTSSDEKLKDNIRVVEGALDKVSALRGVEFEWKKDGTSSAGVIAQDVEKVLPCAVKDSKDLNTDEPYKTVNYDALHALLIESIKELKAEVDALKAAK